ncbi:hypothetical protein B0T25DRAFT_611545 [Lasiosphaeria hispida]|uniref:Uncharacterized protein n=1 Tax=Lasiosphaeria hispida TaxID=260671 RepID=A0AAJ0HGA1_9PEZI|nr:hypothetical protein B0T25DRAFT_611545 [Lasiosphaeria hispida]
MGQIVTEGVADAVCCLLRLTTVIRTPAPHERFNKLRSADDDRASSHGDKKASSVPSDLKDKKASASSDVEKVHLSGPLTINLSRKRLHHTRLAVLTATPLHGLYSNATFGHILLSPRVRTNIIFNLPLEYRTHISKEHPGFALEADVDTAVKISAQPQALINSGGLRRPLCDEASGSDDVSEGDDHQLPPSDEISEQMTDGEERNSKPRHQSAQFLVLPQRFKPETGWDPGWDDNDGTGNTHKASMSMEAMLD